MATSQSVDGANVLPEDVPSEIMLSKAEAAAGTALSLWRRSRIAATRSATLLYLDRVVASDGNIIACYEAAIIAVNQELQPDSIAPAQLRAHWAAGFGQLYRSLVPQGANGTPLTNLPPSDFDVFSEFVQNDVLLTKALMKEEGLLQLQILADPSSAMRVDPNEDDLQALARDDARLRSLLGIAVAPPPPAFRAFRRPTHCRTHFDRGGYTRGLIHTNCPP